MGQTLPNGIYLPAEGERNCYDGLEGNWRSLDGLISTVSGKASATHTHGNITTDGKLATADRVVITDSTKSFTTSNVTATELGYLSGVTSSIQTQLNAKASDSDVVHKSGNETIGGNKTFTGSNKVYELLPSQNGGNLGNASLLHFNGFFEGVYVYDQIKVNGDRGAWIVPVWAGATSGIQILTADGIKPVQIGVATTDANNHIVLDTSKGYVNFYTGSSGTDNKVEFYPVNTAISNLGTSTNKWKTLNGINPGALSLPDLSSGTGVSLSAGANSYSPPSSGWLSINLTGAISVVCGDFCHSGTDMISVPVVKGSTYTVTVATSGTAYLFVSQGNV